MSIVAGTPPLKSGIPVPTEALAVFCRRWNVRELDLFGSVLRDDFQPDSDVDVMIAFDLDVHPSVYDLIDMQDELEAIFGRRIDLITRRAVERSRNEERRRTILDSAKVVYAK